MPKHGTYRIEHTPRKEGKIVEPYRDNTKRKGPGFLGWKEVAGAMKKWQGEWSQEGPWEGGCALLEAATSGNQQSL